MRALAAFRRRTGGPRPVPIALVAALALAAAALPLPARAATLTVNSAADTDARDAWLTLREAILVGNGNGSLALSSLTADEQRQVVGALANPGLNTILFDPGIARVDVGAGGLPTVENPIEIDGGGIVVLAGAAAGVGANGLWIKAGGSTVRGLVIQGFTGSGILLTDGGDNHLEGNRIGATGANGYGVTISDSPGNTVGGQRTLPGPCAAPCNLISGNTTDGILIYGPRATGNFVQGNFIGTDVDGTSPLGNGYGVFVTKLVGVAGAPARNVIGGRNATPWTACTGACNLISGNQGYGVLLLFSGEEGNAVQGNFIGPDVNGKAKVDALEHPLGNALSGVLVSATGAAAGSAPNNTGA